MLSRKVSRQEGLASGQEVGDRLRGQKKSDTKLKCKDGLPDQSKEKVDKKLH